MSYRVRVSKIWHARRVRENRAKQSTNSRNDNPSLTAVMHFKAKTWLLMHTRGDGRAVPETIDLQYVHVEQRYRIG
jgi:hypothetical protein